MKATIIETCIIEMIFVIFIKLESISVIQLTIQNMFAIENVHINSHYRIYWVNVIDGC